MIFFDLDGVLLDSNNVWIQVDDDFLGRRGLSPTPEYLHTVGHSIFPVAAQFTKDYYHLDEDVQSIMDSWQALAQDAYAHTIPLKPGVRELLDKLKAQGRPMAILTASLPALCHISVERHGLDRYFSSIFFAQDHGLEKRDPRVYTIAAAQFGVSPTDCILLEDAPHNCAAAKSVGYTVIGVHDDFYKDHREAVMTNSTKTVENITDLLNEPLLFPDP